MLARAAWRARLGVRCADSRCCAARWIRPSHASFNTFIDDLYALLIPMPTMHRLMCLRDDIICACARLPPAHARLCPARLASRMFLTLTSARARAVFIFLWQRWKYRIDADRPIQM